MNIIELTGARLELKHKLELLNLDEETIADTLESESTELEAKITDYGYVIRNRESFVDAIRDEIERLQARLKAEEVRIQKIEEWLLYNMQRCGISLVESPSFTINVKTNPQSVDVLDERQIPARYMRTPAVKIPEPAPDKKLILDALKAGLDVPGCKIKRSVKLEIK